LRHILGFSLFLLGVGACAVGVDTGDIGGSTSSSGSGGHADATAEAGPSADSGLGGEAAAQDAPSTSDGPGPTPEGGGGPDSGKPADGGAQADASDGGTKSDASDAATAPETGPAPDGSVTCPAHGFSGALVTFDLSAQAGNEASAPVSTTAASVTASALSRASGLTAVSGSGSINASGWPTGSAADASHYYTFTVTPAAGCTMSLSSLALSVRASSTGPNAGNVATSVDSFATHAGALPGTGSQTVQLSATGAGTIEVRIYGFGASSSAGTYRIESTLTLSGSLN
jgi:hypothetical protein